MCYKNKKYYQKQTGFTLMELMITVAIIGILAAITIPSYTKYVQKTKRTDAKVELMKIAQMQESYFVQNMSYANSLTQLGFTADNMASENNEYSISIGSITPNPCTGTSVTACQQFRVDAVPTSVSQVKDEECIRFTLSNTGLKGASTGPTGSPVAGTSAQIKQCWK